jgi:alpha-tubulin suppressor-like RCC1 family protein
MDRNDVTGAAFENRTVSNSLIALLAVLAMISSLAAIPSAQAAVVVSTVSLSVSPSVAAPSESVVLSGAVSPAAAGRTVSLQRLGTSWVNVVSPKTLSTGRFTATVKAGLAGSKTTWRAVAVATTTAAQAVSATRALAVGRPTLSLSAPASVDTSLAFAISGVGYPVRAGRTVVVQRLSGTTWVDVGRAVQSSTGLFSVRTSVGSAAKFSYRAVALSWHGAASVVSPTRVVAAHAPYILLAPLAAITAETVKVSGKLPGVYSRVVRVQRWSGTTWVNLVQAKTSTVGLYASSFKAPKVGSYSVRAWAPQSTVAGKAQTQYATAAKLLSVVAQTASLTIPATLVQAKTGTATAKFTPARAGRAIALQVWKSGAWATLATGKQSSTGTASVAMTAGKPGSYSYRAWTAAAGGAPAFASPARTLVTTPTTTATTVSTGGSTVVNLPNVTVVATPGAIGSGQTLTLARSAVPRTETPSVPSLLGGSLSLSSSQGQPQGPVTVTFSLQPGQLAAGRQPLVLHQETPGGEWSPEPTVLAPDGQTVTVTIDHFSFLDVVDRFSYAFGLVAGNRTDASIEDCTGAPNWVDLIAVPTPISDLNAALWACPKVGSTEQDLVLHVVNNRGYMQVLDITGATVDAQLSHWGTSLEKTFALAGAAATAGSPSSTSQVFLAGGTTADLLIHRPAGPTGQTVTVDITAAPSSDAVLAGLLWTMTKKLNQPTAVASGIINCGFKQWPPADLADVNAYFGVYKSCLKPLISIQGLKLLPQLDTILTADGIGQKLADKITDEQFPPHLALSLAADPVLTITDTTMPGAVVAHPYARTLTATGGNSPYSWLIGAGSLPPGLTLSASGSITGTPPTLGSSSFTVTVRDSVGATANAALTIHVNGAGMIRAESISGGSFHTCALTTAGSVKCWGRNGLGELGDGTNISSATPVDVVGLGSGIAAVSAGGLHSCALTTSGAVKCWGENQYGQLGDGTNTYSTTPVNVVGLGSGIATVSAGAGHSCAVTTAGAVKCWGSNAIGQLEDGTNANSTTPVEVVGLGSGVATVSAGGAHSCAVTTTGAVKCWGINGSGAPGFGIGLLGDGTTADSSTPVDVLGLGSGVTTVSAGDGHSCAVTTAGAVKCWGDNDSGDLGDGTITNSVAPVDVVGLGSGVTAVSAGWSHTCAVTTAGAVKCWGGSPYYGVLGDGATGQSSTPVDVLGLGSGVATVAAGAVHSCVVTTAGAVNCWGDNSNGQLGDGTTTAADMPVAAIGLP